MTLPTRSAAGAAALATRDAAKPTMIAMIASGGTVAVGVRRAFTTTIEDTTINPSTDSGMSHESHSEPGAAWWAASSRMCV
jgi:hypothetical protein